eukprot:2890636-Rhodomonas_salina.8
MTHGVVQERSSCSSLSAFWASCWRSWSWLCGRDVSSGGLSSGRMPGRKYRPFLSCQPFFAQSNLPKRGVSCSSLMRRYPQAKEEFAKRKQGKTWAHKLNQFYLAYLTMDNRGEWEVRPDHLSSKCHFGCFASVITSGHGACP